MDDESKVAKYYEMGRSEVLNDLMSIANKNEYEELRREVEIYAKQYGVEITVKSDEE